MTVTTVTGPGRVVQCLWGATQQSTLQLSYPMALDQPRFWRGPRVGSEQVVVNNRAESWTSARDFYAAFTVRWVPLASWSGGDGVQAFLDAGANAGPFTFVPDAANAPLFGLAGCVLLKPFTQVVPALESDGSQTIEIMFRNPTYDLGLAWR